MVSATATGISQTGAACRCAGMTATSAKDVVLQAWREFAGRDPERIGAVFTPDAEWLAPEGNATAVALGGIHHLVGRDRIVHFLTVEFPSVFVADVHVDFRSMVGDGDIVVVEARMQATLHHGGHYDNEYSNSHHPSSEGTFRAPERTYARLAHGSKSERIVKHSMILFTTSWQLFSIGQGLV